MEAFLGQMEESVNSKFKIRNDAIAIYDKVKFEHDLFDYGIVDTAKILQNRSEVYNNSLAEEYVDHDKYSLILAIYYILLSGKC